MSTVSIFHQFRDSERGAVTVDWTVLSAAAVGMAIAATALLTDTFAFLSGQMDEELRSRSMSEDWIAFAATHFEDMLQTGYITEEEANLAYDAVTPLLNNQIISALAAGIEALEAGTLSSEELVSLIAYASVAHQRNIVDDAVLDYYFGFGGSDPYYMTTSAAPSSTG